MPAVPARAPRHADRRRRRGVLRLGRGGRARSCSRCASSREPLVDVSGPWPWLGLQSGFDAIFPKGELRYWKSRCARRAVGRGDRRDRRARRPPADAAHRHRDLAPRRRDERASARPRRRTAAATRRSSSPPRRTGPIRRRTTRRSPGRGRSGTRWSATRPAASTSTSRASARRRRRSRAPATA